MDNIFALYSNLPLNLWIKFGYVNEIDHHIINFNEDHNQT